MPLPEHAHRSKLLEHMLGNGGVRHEPPQAHTEEPLERLAKTSGGEAYFSAVPAELALQFSGIIENLRQRYVLSYTSTNPKHDGAWRHVEIRPHTASLIVATGGGYFAPSP